MCAIFGVMGLGAVVSGSAKIVHTRSIFLFEILKLVRNCVFLRRIQIRSVNI